MSELDTEEQEILDAYHEEKLERVALSAAEVEAYREAARGILRKDQRVNIRLPSGDLEALKIKAMEEGMPYQTLMASVLHRFISGQLIAKA